MARTIQNKIRMSRANKDAVLSACAAGAPYVVVGRFAGIATGFRTHTGQYGESFGLEGAFGFVDGSTGELEEARIAWGPAMVVDPVVAALQAGAQSVKVGPVDVIAKPNGQKTGIVYGYITHEANDSSPVLAMLAGVEPLKIAHVAQGDLPLETTAESTAPTAEPVTESTVEPDTESVAAPAKKKNKS